MNPWIDEQLGAAHRGDMERQARDRTLPAPTSRRPGAARPAVGWARRRVGWLLVRAGSRLGGLDPQPGAVLRPTHP